MTSHNFSVRPQIDQAVDVAVERIRFHIQNAMHEDIRLQRAHEEHGCSARIAAPDHAGGHGAAEVMGDDRQTAPGRAVGVARVEGNHHRARFLMHVDCDVLRDRFLHEGDESPGDIAQHDSRIGAGVGVRQLEDAIGRGGDAAAHGGLKKLLFGFEISQDCRRTDAELRCDIGQCRGLESFYREHPAGGFKKLIAGDARGASH